MKHFAEAVLNGHPDKFCDLLTDRIIRELYRKEPGAYAQLEASVWSNKIFLTGAWVTENPANIKIRDLVVELGEQIGYTIKNCVKAKEYVIIDEICKLTGNPRKWTGFSGDQCIITGYAGYDAKTRFLPPEQYLVMYLRESLMRSMMDGLLEEQGPDGKVMVTMLEEPDGWKPQTILVTIQQQESLSFYELTNRVEQVLQEAWKTLRQQDHRWSCRWDEIQVIINPNGPLVNGGSAADNGQTGRKLVMDYYGPRLAIGGGALYGKDLYHIDRLGAFQARRFAKKLVRDGAKEALVRICYAPGMKDPLMIDLKTDRRPQLDARDYFRFDNMRERVIESDLEYGLLELGTFYNDTLSWANETPPQINKSIINL
jgi:S-adenosylmethionine synthetase